MNGSRETAAEQILSRVDSRSSICGVVGLGFIGSMLMDALVAVGYQVHGFDRAPETANRFRNWMNGRAPESGGRWTAACDASVLADAEIVIVAVRTPVERGADELEPLEAVSETLRRYRREPRLILLESTVRCGTTRCFAASLEAGPGTFVAHSPERLSVGHDRHVFRRTPHLVGGLDVPAGEVAAHFLRTLCERVVVASQPEVSELSKLLENAFLTVGIALSNEVTRIAHAIGIPAEEVCAAAASKSFGYYPFFPGPGVGGHCLVNDLQILIATSKSVGAESPLLNAAASTCAIGPDLVLRRLEKLFREHQLQFENQRILLVGVGFKPGTVDTTESPARAIARLLRQRGVDVSYVDALVREFVVDGQAIPRLHAAELASAKFAAVLIVAGDHTVPLDLLPAVSDVVLDARGKSSEQRPDSIYTL